MQRKSNQFHNQRKRGFAVGRGATESWLLPLSVLASLLLNMAATGRPADRSRAMLPPDEVIVRMEERFRHQIASLETYQDRRRYSVAHPLLGNGTYWVVEEKFSAPDAKHFQVLERGGSGAVQKRVFAKLLEIEKETARDAVRPQVDLSRDNYAFTYLGFDESRNAYRFQAIPHGTNEYLLRGTIWINAADFAVQRIEGEPASSHSLLIKRVSFVHEFAKFGEFWFPVHHRSVTELRVFGTAILEINYSGYEWRTHSSNGNDKGTTRLEILSDARNMDVNHENQGGRQ